MYTDKIVLVTGASRGIGLSLVEYFISKNAFVIGISKSESKYQHKNYNHFAVDIGNPESVSNLFRKEISKKFKKIDIVINNAAVLTSQYAMIMPIKNAVDMVNVNLLGSFFVSRESAKLMRDKSGARIINIGSMASSLEPMGDSIYAATKAGLISISNILAKELSSYNVTCNTVGITAIETDMLNSHTDSAKQKIKEIISSLPVSRMAKIEDITNVIDFFASPNSSYITAQTIFLGGIHQ